MDGYFAAFERKMVAAGLVEPGRVTMGFLDDRIAWNKAGRVGFETELFDRLSINSLMVGVPAEPYLTILRFLASRNPVAIEPRDCETRTFLHDLPVTDSRSAEKVSAILKKRKSAIITDGTLVTTGTVSLEQAFVTFSSVCFSAFVTFFSDYLALHKKGVADPEYQKVFQNVSGLLPPPVPVGTALMQGPFTTDQQVIAAMDQAGKKTVEYRLVDSYFGNISYRLGETLYISQTGSSLDDLPGCIDPCSLTGRSCAAITASSELGAHMNILTETGKTAILHGHPRFSVILSMDCDVADCEGGDACYRTCAYTRDVLGVPIVSGEVGGGPFGLCNTVPAALAQSPAAIVYGHGLFAVSDTDFNEAFRLLHSIENRCRDEYFRRVGNGQENLFQVSWLS